MMPFLDRGFRVGGDGADQPPEFLRPGREEENPLGRDGRKNLVMEPLTFRGEEAFHRNPTFLKGAVEIVEIEFLALGQALEKGIYRGGKDGQVLFVILIGVEAVALAEV